MTAPNVVVKWSAWAPRLLSVLRILTAFSFIQAGTAVCCFIWLYVSAAGAGPWSLDARRAKGYHPPTP